MPSDKVFPLSWFTFLTFFSDFMHSKIESSHTLRLQWISTQFGRAGSETSWELGNYIPENRGFVVIGANQIANFEMKTMSLILKFDSKFANFASQFEVYQDEMASQLL